MDASTVGKTAADFMQRLDEEGAAYAEEGAINVRLGEVLIIGEILYEDEDGDTMISVTTASSTINRVHQTGIAAWGKRLVFDTGSDAEAGDEE